MTAKKVPLSVEDLLKKQKEEENALKPKFLTKEERAAIAIKKREEEVEAIRKKREEDLKATKLTYGKNGDSINDKYQDKNDRRERDRGRDRDRDRDRNRDKRNDRYRERDGDRDRRRGSERYRDRSPRREDRGYERERSRRDKDSSKRPDLDTPAEEKPSEVELEAIRQRYMGGGLNSNRKVRKINERKFVFDWDANEDTSKDHNPLYSQRHLPQLFGRGKFAGYDDNDKVNEPGKFYDHLLHQRRNEDEKSRARAFNGINKQKEEKVMWKERHWSEKSLDEMKERDWRIFREDFSISTKGGNIPKPIRSWEESSLPTEFKEVIKKVGYKEPTPIQRQAIPIGLQNRDIIGIAETGSGKTASFVIPMLAFISKLPSLKNNIELQEKGPYAVILAPTRELAQQIEQETKKFAEPIGCKCISIIGGHSIRDQAYNLREGAEIVIATPGRLRDCLEQKIIVFTQCTYLVMDEADRMVDMGFETDVNYILEAFPVSNLRPETAPFAQIDNNGNETENKEELKIYRQTIMFSATMPPPVERIARKFMRLPVTVTIGNAGQAVESVKQIVEMVNDDNQKRNKIATILQEGYEPPIIIFANQIKTCDKISTDISKLGYRSVILHGRKTQDQRENALDQLKSGKADVLVATDVAARGIDVKDVSLVVNYDMANKIESYTHRIGRTGRAGKTGTAITFLTRDDSEVFFDLRQMLLKAKAFIPPELNNHEAAKIKPGGAFNH